MDSVTGTYGELIQIGNGSEDGAVDFLVPTDKKFSGFFLQDKTTNSC